MRRRTPLIVILAVGVAARVMLLLTTRGTDDVIAFRLFAEQISRLGPYRIYRAVTVLPYNHAPITGWMLRALWFGAHHGLPFAIGLRSFAVLADIGSALVAYLVISKRFGETRALGAATLVALNPVAIFLSGFHGNVDPVALFFTLLAFYLAVDRDAPLLAGIAFAIGLGVKIVPLVTFPLLLFVVLRHSDLRRFIVGFVSISLIVWAPALAIARAAVISDVFGYSGGKGHLVPMLVFAVSATAGIVVYQRSNAFAGAAAALLSLFALSPAWAAQYVVWPVAFGAAAALEIPALVYAVIGGSFLFEWYSHWWGRFPWHHAFTPAGADSTAARLFLVLRIGALAWVALLALQEKAKAPARRNPEGNLREPGLRRFYCACVPSRYSSTGLGRAKK